LLVRGGSVARSCPAAFYSEKNNDHLKCAIFVMENVAEPKPGIEPQKTHVLILEFTKG
jgi:hypothetical protein